jgi:hypothetical protein
MFAGLRSTLEHACLLREQGEIEVLPMGALAPVEALEEKVVVVR